jgi:hypothetical protein
MPTTTLRQRCQSLNPADAALVESVVKQVTALYDAQQRTVATPDRDQLLETAVDAHLSDGADLPDDLRAIITDVLDEVFAGSDDSEDKTPTLTNATLSQLGTGTAEQRDAATDS